MNNQDKWGNNLVSNFRDFFIEVALGNVPGYSLVNVTGHNPNVNGDLVTVWDIPDTNYTYLPGNTTLYLSSSDNGDVGIPVYTTGLNFAGAMINDTVVSDGYNQVALNTQFWRAFNSFVVGTSTTPSGDLYLSSELGNLTNGVPNDVSKIKAKIIQGNNRTNHGFQTVPAGYTVVPTAVRGSIPKLKDTQLLIYTRFYNEVEMRQNPFQIYQNNFEFILLRSGVTFPEKTDIEVKASSSVTGTPVSVELDGLLVDNNYIGWHPDV
jgi:hypothetical protein